MSRKFEKKTLYRPDVTEIKYVFVNMDQVVYCIETVHMNKFYYTELVLSNGETILVNERIGYLS